MDIFPLDDRILVENIEGLGKSSGGIIIPDMATEKATMGRVVAVGTGRIFKNGKEMSLSLKVGDVIKFKPYAGNEVDIDGKVYSIMKEDEVFGVIEE